MVRGKSVEVAALGHELWSWTADNTHTAVRLDRLGLRFKAERRSENNESASARTVMEGSLTGVLSFANFESAHEARADLFISNTSNSVLRARIRRKPLSATVPTVGDLAQLAAELAVTPLSDLSADASPKLSFDHDENTPLYLHMDLGNTSHVRMLLAGNVSGVGECLFLARLKPQTGVRDYVVSITSLSAFFKTTARAATGGELDLLSSSCDLAPIRVRIISYSGTRRDLVTDMAACAAALEPGAGANSTSTTTSCGENLAPISERLITPALAMVLSTGRCRKAPGF